MDKRENGRQIRAALNTTLSGLRDDPRLAQRVIAGAKGAKQVKKKISVGLAIALALMMIVATALAVVTLREVARMIAQTEQDSGSFGHWPAEKKIAVVTALADQGYIGETDAVTQMRKGMLGADEASETADALIEAFTGWDADDVGFMVIMQAAWGPFDSWSDEDRAWYSMVMEDVGVESDGKTVYVLPEGRIGRDQAVEIATKAIVEGMGIEESVLQNYNLAVNFQIPEFAEEGDEQPYWYVMYDAKENSPDNPFYTMELFVHPQTGELLKSVEEILEGWGNVAELVRRPVEQEEAIEMAWEAIKAEYSLDDGDRDRYEVWASLVENTGKQIWNISFHHSEEDTYGARIEKDTGKILETSDAGDGVG